MNVSVKVAGKHGPLDVIVDSTGLKVYDEGEWKVRKHGRSKHRTWRKLHIAVDPITQQIDATERLLIAATTLLLFWNFWLKSTIKSVPCTATEHTTNEKYIT